MPQQSSRKSANLKDLKSMAIAMIAALAMPLGVYMTREGPLEAKSAPELASIARERTREKVIEEISWRVDPYNTTPGQIEQRWLDVRDNWSTSDVADGEADGVIKTAQQELKGQCWPVLATRGWLNNEPVWVVVSGWQSKGSGKTYICPPSTQDLQRDRQEGIERYTRVLVIDSRAPYRLLSG